MGGRRDTAARRRLGATPWLKLLMDASQWVATVMALQMCHRPIAQNNQPLLGRLSGQFWFLLESPCEAVSFFILLFRSGDISPSNGIYSVLVSFLEDLCGTNGMFCN